MPKEVAFVGCWMAMAAAMEIRRFRSFLCLPLLNTINNMLLVINEKKKTHGFS
uniref:Uncharacterized protein n=1 Tax=Ascaris lumbricoides TaxID=6252 RepID=A0A0M3ISS0_ASCLU